MPRRHRFHLSLQVQVPYVRQKITFASRPCRTTILIAEFQPPLYLALTIFPRTVNPSKPSYQIRCRLRSSRFSTLTRSREHRFLQPKNPVTQQPISATTICHCGFNTQSPSILVSSSISSSSNTRIRELNPFNHAYQTSSLVRAQVEPTNVGPTISPYPLCLCLSHHKRQ